jgi:hypothetical protein
MNENSLQDTKGTTTKKGTMKNPQIVTVRQESAMNKTLGVTLTRAVLDTLDCKIKKGDVLVEWADPRTKTIYLRKQTIRGAT